MKEDPQKSSIGEKDEKHGGNAEERKEKTRIWSGKGNRESDLIAISDDDGESVGICRRKRPGSASEI